MKSFQGSLNGNIFSLSTDTDGAAGSWTVIQPDYCLPIPQSQYLNTGYLSGDRFPYLEAQQSEFHKAIFICHHRRMRCDQPAQRQTLGEHFMSWRVQTI
ncbi:hypothetical protein NPIL_692431 [Nephila pilipes]|uniref:Uncharacterized protein n=1 Tax=Nephila pilipes TaxID=299642 RepID=A0A8X6P7Q6_NEPPI|nr:hypothetical protein NPIL_307491 [Nephila pilipes]GFT52031.1 hypothetical protein NPIL_692431 [Nephila pilipes]